MASPKTKGFRTLSDLRAEAKKRLAAGDKNLKGYYRDSKSKLASKLGYSDDARNMTSAKNLKQRAENAAASVAGDSEGKRTVLKQRILRSVKREVDAARKANPDISQQELRKVAAQALGNELRQIKAGRPEKNLRKEAAQVNKAKDKAAERGLDYVLDRDRSGRIREMLNKGEVPTGPISDAYLNIGRGDTRHFKNSQEFADRVVKAYKRRPKEESKPITPEPEQKLKPEDLKTADDRAKYAKQEADYQRSQGNEAGAKKWEEQARISQRAALQRDIDKTKQSQTSLFGVEEHSSDMPLFANSGDKQDSPKESPSGRGASLPKTARGLHEVDPNDLDFDPKRFQYKLIHGESGASGSLTDVRKWDDNLGGVLQVWRDPKDGKDYVVNGHNRLNLAKKLGAERVAVRYLNVDSPAEARAIGALTNIAEGRGNSMDAAKFFRDTGITRADLEKKGIPLKEKIATDGLALSSLAPHLFDKVVQGDIPQERAVAIGSRVTDHDAQTKLHDLIEREQKKGRKITNDVVRELADTVQSASSISETQFSLFGAEESSRNLALEKAELQAAIRQRLSREKKLFGVVSKSKAAQDLAKAGNRIDTERSKDISDQAGQVLGIFDQLKNQAGPVSERINKAAERIANGEDKRKVTDELQKQLIEEIPQALGLGKKSNPKRVQSTPASGEEEKTAVEQIAAATGRSPKVIGEAAKRIRARAKKRVASMLREEMAKPAQGTNRPMTQKPQQESSSSDTPLTGVISRLKNIRQQDRANTAQAYTAAAQLNEVARRSLATNEALMDELRKDVEGDAPALKGGRKQRALPAAKATAKRKRTSKK